MSDDLTLFLNIDEISILAKRASCGREDAGEGMPPCMKKSDFGNRVAQHGKGVLHRVQGCTWGRSCDELIPEMPISVIKRSPLLILLPCS